ILDLVVHARESLNHEQMEPSPLITINVPNHLSVFVDPDLFELALINLLRNASQAAQENVFVGYGESHDYWWITISDDGQRIPIDMDLSQLLEPFFTTKPKGQGTGLGLAIVNNIVNDHHGELMLRRSEQGGLIVTLQFSKEQWV
ncbi:ATP-binding protein, partial [Vibrio sp. V29_P1S30P107]|uniref:ATP-binding protein n=2 Tax=Vibrio TaxID=662 RepID=UPI00137359B6